MNLRDLSPMRQRSLQGVSANARVRTRKGGGVGATAQAETGAVKVGAIKVLVIDDSKTIRRSADLFLRQAGYQVILAEVGVDALSKISDPPVRVIFLDIIMLGPHAYQTCCPVEQNP